MASMSSTYLSALPRTYQAQGAPSRYNLESTSPDVETDNSICLSMTNMFFFFLVENEEVE